MTEEELQAKSEENWRRLDAVKRMYCVWRLREIIGPEDQALLKQAFETSKWPLGFHHFSGMAIRNELRKVVKDEELPLVDYGGGHFYQNWDDFYMAALRQAVAPQGREI